MGLLDEHNNRGGGKGKLRSRHTPQAMCTTFTPPPPAYGTAHRQWMDDTHDTHVHIWGAHKPPAGCFAWGGAVGGERTHRRAESLAFRPELRHRRRRERSRLAMPIQSLAVPTCPSCAERGGWRGRITAHRNHAFVLTCLECCTVRIGPQQGGPVRPGQPLQSLPGARVLSANYVAARRRSIRRSPRSYRMIPRGKRISCRPELEEKRGPAGRGPGAPSRNPKRS